MLLNCVSTQKERFHVGVKYTPSMHSEHLLIGLGSSDWPSMVTCQIDLFIKVMSPVMLHCLDQVNLIPGHVIKLVRCENIHQ